jgi:hypothetical protein
MRCWSMEMCRAAGLEGKKYISETENGVGQSDIRDVLGRGDEWRIFIEFSLSRKCENEACTRVKKLTGRERRRDREQQQRSEDKDKDMTRFKHERVHDEQVRIWCRHAPAYPRPGPLTKIKISPRPKHAARACITSP